MLATRMSAQQARLDPSGSTAHQGREREMRPMPEIKQSAKPAENGPSD